MPLSAMSTVVIILCCLISIGSAAAWTKPSRQAVPEPPKRHVAVMVLLTTPTHAILPLLAAKELVARGHRVSWIETKEHEHWLGTPQERARLNFNFTGVTYPEYRVNNDQLMDQLQKAPFLYTMDWVFHHIVDPLYQPSYDALHKLIQTDRPDIISCDMFAIACVDLAHHYHIPFVITIPTGLGDFGVGDTFDRPMVLTGFSQNWHTQPMWHRFYNTFLLLPQIIYHTMTAMSRMNAIRASNGMSPTVTMTDKWSGHDIIFSAHWAWDAATYVPPYYHMIGPVHKASSNESMIDPSKIEPSLRAWMDEHHQKDRTVVYFALGSVGALSEHQLVKMMNAFRDCPAKPTITDSYSTTNASTRSLNQVTTATSAERFHILWSTKAPLPASIKSILPSNVRIEKWVAQPAILAHPAVRAFISHTGTASLLDAIAVAVPILGMPLFGDQPGNAARLQDSGAALVIDRWTFTSDELCYKLQQTSFNPLIQANMSKLQLIYHINGNGYTRAATIIEEATVSQIHRIPYRENYNISFIIRYNIDVFTIGFLIIVSIIIIFILFFYYSIKYITSIISLPMISNKNKIKSM